ncbi:MAG: PAS domain-containing protein [Thalassobaculaceae bacterium]
MSGLISTSVGRFRQDRLRIADPAQTAEIVGSHPKAVRLLDAWNAWRGERPLPDRADVDPIDIPDLLPNLILLDVEDDDFRFRLVGEQIASRYGGRLKGRLISEVMSGPGLDETLYEHRRCAEDRRAVIISQARELATADDRRAYMRLILPLGNDGPRASHIIGVMDFYW